MLSIVGISSEATTDFLLRTEGVAMLGASGIIWASRQLRAAPKRLVLVSLAGYYTLGSLVDLAAFWQGIVGAASVPSAGARLILAALCVAAAVKLPQETTDGS
jgi:membrane associated rhomboid family serine protease